MEKHQFFLIFINIAIAQAQQYSFSYVIKKDLEPNNPLLPTTNPSNLKEPLPVIQIKNEEPPFNTIEISKSTIQSIPYRVGLFENGTQYCGGAIINERFIATTAYCCLIANIQATRIIVGTTNTNNGKIIDVTTFYIHGAYDYTTKNYDLCLIKLTKPLQWNTNIQPIKLPVRELPEFTPVIITSFSEIFNKHLLINEKHFKQIQAFHTDKQTCRKRLNTFITDDMMCIGNLNNDKAACDINNGDPLIVSGYLYGLASWNLNCDPLRTKQPSIFTNIYPLKNFILEIVKKHNSD